jgi:hypothetical protein
MSIETIHMNVDVRTCTCIYWICISNRFSDSCNTAKFVLSYVFLGISWNRPGTYLPSKSHNSIILFIHHTTNLKSKESAE